MKNKHNLTVLLSVLLVFFSYSLASNAQVTIGSCEAPTRASLLQLKTRQASTVVNTVGDDDNITSNEGGLLLPRVKLVSTTTLEPFVPTTDPDWTDPTRQKALRMSVAGLMVYNIASVGTSLYPSVYTWDGLQWSTSQANPSKMEIAAQPQAFTFYETGTEAVQPLTFSISGATGVTYQWYQLTGSNVHVRVGTPVTQGAGGATASYTPTQVIKGTTRNANNTGFYKFYCIAQDAYGKILESKVAEVAVGCGAKNNLGEWISFMCFNLGADNNSTIATTINYSINPIINGSGFHDYILGEENLYGDLFQWGRIPDGHQKRQSPSMAYGNNGGNPSRAMSTDEIVNGKKCYSTEQDGHPWQQVKQESLWYGKFIYEQSIWNPIAQAYSDVLWRTGRFAQNDPCARYNTDGTYQEFWHNGINNTSEGISACTDTGTAWRIPTQAEWGEIYKGATLSGSPNVATANTWVWNKDNGRGYEIKPDGATTTLFLPAGGFRSSGNGFLYFQGVVGYYWSLSTFGNSGYSLSFNGGFIGPSNSNDRSYGFALRCVKNQ